MPATETLGDNYTIREDSNGDYEIEHNTLGFVLRFSDANDVLSFLKDVEVGDVIDESSGNTVYDSSIETIGYGNQDANLNSLSTAELNNANAVINNNSPDSNIRIINVSSDTSTNSGETIDLFKFPHGGANATVAGVADITQGFVNGDSPVFSSVEFQKSSNNSWSGTTSASSELDLVPINGGDELVFRVTSTQDFARIACFCRVWTSNASPIEILVNR